MTWALSWARLPLLYFMWRWAAARRRLVARHYLRAGDGVKGK
jgi:hypothetical protein